MPKVYIINQSQPNAFATGRNAKHAAVACTTGLMQILDEKELEAMQTLVDVVKSTGHGNVIDGVEEIRENHTFIVKLRKKCERASETVSQTLIKGITGAVMLAVAIGAAYLLLKQTGNGGS